METSTWTNIELIGGGGAPALRAEQVEIEWPRMSYIQRLLTWLKARFGRFVGTPTPVTEPKPAFGAVAQEYLCDTYDVQLPKADPHI
jgi:hypothetical protein